MKGLNKIEEKLNQALTALSTAIKSKLFGLVPPKVSQISQDKKLLLKEKKLIYTQKLKEKTAVVRSKAAQYKKATQGKVDQVKKIDIKKVKSKHLLTGFLAFLAPSFNKFKLWYFTLKPQTIALSVAGTTVVTLASLNIYVESQKISEKKEAAAHAEQVDKVNKASSLTRRPSYYKREEKQFHIEGVFLPIYLGERQYLQRLELDFTVQASNKYIKAYFNKNHFLIRDRLNTQISPIEVDFPLQQEGKDIIKQKIRKELNRLIDEQGIKGEVKEVDIGSIFGA